MARQLEIDKDYNDMVDRRPIVNSTCKKLALQWLNEVQLWNQTFVLVDRFVLPNSQLPIAAKRLMQA